MKTLITILICLLSFKSNGQDTTQINRSLLFRGSGFGSLVTTDTMIFKVDTVRFIAEVVKDWNKPKVEWVVAYRIRQNGWFTKWSDKILDEKYNPILFPVLQLIRKP